LCLACTQENKIFNSEIFSAGKFPDRQTIFHPRDDITMSLVLPQDVGVSVSLSSTG